ncbi:MarR family transcriptional regulator [Mycobacterium sp. CVI_P3]|uniref:MarR family transcriptional regulator n=1 Tax=Mycobacterium pinniadriaticum TaxID=2994102 RepID=A0ABT3SCX1_9MYCO|nr:MarR family transcriptional regulator [Mycobacterium pinniadriaticum]MCX2930564.1 MarR family transcriptional regulator [Mycobacterium pinniadriaticum]MCX2936988.1 MarR family transcriptional regulator [Mycobacterium pinniadriaticum]
MNDADENLLWLLKQAFHYAGHTVNEAISHHGVTSAQIGLLRQLADEPGLSGADLARRLLISPQGAQLALAPLARNGLIERKPDPEHGRIQRAYLTEKGRRILAMAHVDAMTAYESLFSVLTAGERKTLAELLVRIVVQGHGEVSFTLHPPAD